jgi:hypothetical protein
MPINGQSQLLRPLQVKYPTATKGDKAVNGYIGDPPG